MTVWDQIAWAPICIALTAVGLGASWLIWRRKGPQHGLRAGAWSLLPLAAYLTGAIVLIGRIGSAVVRFASGFAFSPKSWAGVILFGGSALLFLATGGLPLLRWRKSRGKGKKAAAVAATGGPQLPAAAGQGRQAVAGKAKQAAAVQADDDFGDVQEILRRRGIQ
jgi:hypothetical protein